LAVELPKLWDEGDSVLRRSASTRWREGNASARLVVTYEESESSLEVSGEPPVAVDVAVAATAAGRSKVEGWGMKG
jgi:hypothetical protein